MIIAIDGPAGSGKTTVSRLLAKKLNISYLDTGATYRALTLKALQMKLNLKDFAQIKEAAEGIDIAFKDERVFLDGKDVTEQIRTPLIDKNISKIASNPLAREVMVLLQRRIAQGKDVVAEGRDVTTVVFPDAEYKFYLDAHVDERTKRRYKEFKEKEVSISYEELSTQVKTRDKADFTRDVGPLKKTKDARVIDTTTLTLEQVVDSLTSYIQKK